METKLPHEVFGNDIHNNNASAPKMLLHSKQGKKSAEDRIFLLKTEPCYYAPKHRDLIKIISYLLKNDLHCNDMRAEFNKNCDYYIKELNKIKEEGKYDIKTLD